MKSEPHNPLCFSCKHRRNLPGDAHSGCVHPQADFIGMLVGDDPLNIAAVPYGVQSGWFMWPLNFDPVWLTNCDGYEQK